jgi:putative membrane protein
MKKTLAALLIATSGLALAADKSLSRSDKVFFDKAAAGGMFEVEVGKLAESRAQSADVKAFGAMLVKDHGAANEELKALAQKKGLALPPALPNEQRKSIDKLAKAKDFDREFIKEVGLDDHKKDIKLFERASKDSKDADVKAFAAKTLPTLQQHHQKAEELARAMKGRKA